MILKLLFIQTSYFMLSKSIVSSYVLFAANIDDFKSIANKILPGHLAEQLAVNFNPKTKSYRLEKNHEAEDKDASSEYYDSENDSSENVSFSDAQKVHLKAININPKKRYHIKKQNVDLDELVKRVKEKLEAEYKIASKVQAEEDLSTATTERGKRIEDYYYKDDTLNENFNENDEPEQIEKTLAGPSFTIKRPKYASDYEVVNVYNEEVPYKNTEYNNGYLKEKDSKAIINLREPKRTTRYVDAYSSENIQDGKYVKEDSELVEYNTKDVDGAKIIGKEINPENASGDASYEDNAKETQNAPLPEIGEFENIDLLKSNDSYEDYVTPKRDNIFESDEPVTEKTVTLLRPLANVQQFAADDSNHNLKAVADSVKIKEQKLGDYKKSPPPKIEVPMKSPLPREVKGKTASMWYKDPKIENYDEFTKKMKVNVKEKTTTMRLRTMFATRAHFKFSSPNYFAKIPAMAEKYNFDEPLPEKDREPEEIKYIGNPPASINKKVKI